MGDLGGDTVDVPPAGVNAMLTRAFVEALPKAEVHLHLEGAVPWTMVRGRAAEPLPERPAWWADDFRFDDFTQFRRIAQRCLAALSDLPTYRAVAAAVFADLRAQNVRYVEVSFDAVRVLEQALAFADVVAAIKSATPPGLIVRVFGAFSYHKPERTPPGVVEAVLATPGLDGIDLHGDEARGTTAAFAGAFAGARRRGLITKAHAGELAGPESVTRALDLLGVRRIEHGVHAIDEPALVTRLAADGITLDMCPWSNVKLRVWPDLATHPIRRLHAAGVPVTVSTDDPTIFGRSLTDELVALIDDLAFTPADVARFQANAFAVAAMPAAAREAVLGEIDALRR